MKKKWIKKFLSLFMTLCLLMEITPISSMAEGVKSLTEIISAATGLTDSSMPEVIYSDDVSVIFEDSAPEYGEAEKSKELILRRVDNSSDELNVTVQIYDNSTNYGQDYILKYGNTVIEKLDGAISIYDAFRINGELTGNLPVDAAENYVTYNEATQTDSYTQVSAADMLAQLQNIGAMAANFAVTIPEGENTASLTVEIINDDLSEYDENFLAILLDAEGQVIENSQILCSVIDDEADPTVYVEFDCEAEIEADEKTDMAQLTFKRSGNLATTTTSVLMYNGEPMGYVNFAPYQDTQVVLALPGTYTLYSDGDYTVSDETVIVSGKAQPLPEGADPVLDAVPEQYAAFPSMLRTISNNNWFPDWAKNRTYTYEDKNSIVVMGSSSNGLFEKDSSSTDGSVSFDSSRNMYRMNTEGGEKKGYLFLRSKDTYDLTGIESVEGSVYISDLTTGYCDVIFGVWNVDHDKIYTKDNDSTQNLKYTLPDNYQGNRYIYYCNSDLKGIWDCGWNGYAPNGFKMNKREYYIYVDNPNELSYESDNGIKYTPKLSSNRSYHMTMSSDNKIEIKFDSDSNYRCKLVGYRLKNKAGQLSDIISLENQSYITFDRNFLKKYENSWCYDAPDPNGKTYNTFVICPVFEKIQVDYDIIPSTMGELYIDTPKDGKLHKGDTVVFSADGNMDNSFAAVRVVKYTEKNGTIVSVSTESVIENEETLELILTDPKNEIGYYTFQPLFGTDHNHLYVNYENPVAATRHGKLLREEGLMLNGDQYRVNDYFTLLADADDGYVTVWKAGEKVFYGDTFFYQLDADPESNSITVDFVAENELTMSTGTIKGNLSRKDKNYLTNTVSLVAFSDADYTVTGSHGTYNGKTDNDGNFTIENFKGVNNGTYSMIIRNNSRTVYMEFKYIGDGTYKLELPQFSSTDFFPTSFSVGGPGVGIASNFITLSESNPAEISVEVYVPSEEYTITDVKLHFVPNVGTEGFVLEATRSEDGNKTGPYETWKAKAYASEVPTGTHLYVSVSAERTYSYEDSAGSHTSTVPMTTDLIDTGWNVTLNTDDPGVPIAVDVPEIPGVGDAATFGGATTFNRRSAVAVPEIPIIGTLDMSFTSRKGAYFVQQANSDGTYSLMCGYGITPTYNNNDDITDAVAAAAKTKAALVSAQSGHVKGSVKMTGSTTSNYGIEPLFMLNFTVAKSEDESGNEVSKLIGFEFALGVDSFISKSIPTMAGPVPVYVRVNMDAEVFAQMQVAFPEAKNMDDSLSDVILESSAYATENGTEIQGMFAAPELSFGVKGGIGADGVVSVFAEGTAHTPFIMDFTPWDAAGGISFNIGIGADIILFTAEVEVSTDQYNFGNEELQDQLVDLQKVMTGVTPSAALYTLRSSGKSYQTLDDAFENMTFAVAERPAQTVKLLRSGTVDNATLAKGVFKNTNIHLVKLDSGKIMALFLADNHAEDGSLNYLSVAYTVSNDNGKTWSQIEYVSENIGQDTTSLQYDINVYELQDRILVTWSEADFDTLLKGVDLNNLTAAQMAKVMGALDLKGRFFDKSTGEFMSEAFTVAENSTVFCGALDAVQNGDTVYIYYQRNALSTEDDVTVEDLLSKERTIAMASANVNDTSTWISVPVRAMNEDGQQYRITEVVPFVHDGILGEIAVLDRNGRLTVTDPETGKLVPDIEDRQIYLRTYDFNENGEPVPTALIALTDMNDCAQSPQVLSTDDYLHLMWNNNGEVVYMSDFVARDTDDESIQAEAFVIANSDGTITVRQPAETGAVSVGDGDSLHIGTKFTASIADDGNVFVCWVGTDNEDESLIPTDEIYGIILENKTDAEVVEIMKKTANNQLDDTDEGDPDTYRLWAANAPVALTDGDNPIGALSSLCLESGEENKFLLAYTRLDNILRKESTSADILTQTRSDAPSLEASVEFPDYPLPGTVAVADVTVTNDGLDALNGVSITASGIGQTQTVNYDGVILPGHSADFSIEIPVPADFAASTVLNITASGIDSQSVYSCSAETEVLYGSYIIPTDLPDLTAIPNSTDCLAQIQVRNIGNATGTVTLDLINRVYASVKQEDVRNYTFASDVVVTPGGEAVVNYVMQDTLMNPEVYSTVQVWTGDGYDQGTEAFMPDPETLTFDDIKLEVDEPENPDIPTEPDEPTEDTCDRCGLVHTNIFQKLICLLMDLMNRVLDMLISIFI